MKIVLNVRQIISVVSTLTELGSPGGKQFLVLYTVYIHVSERKFQHTFPMLPSLGIVVNIWELFMRQNIFCGVTEGCLSKQTAVSILLNVLHVHVKQQNPVIG